MTADTCDVIVIGAGPAGLAAAQSVADHGLSVRLIDEQPAAGGQIWRNAGVVTRRGGPLAKSYGSAAAALSTLQNARVQHAPNATVLDVSLSEGTDMPVRVTWLSADPAKRGVREISARALIIATGAMERPVLFAGATLPGVMGVGAVQSILKQSALVPKGDGVVLAGQGPLLLLTLAQILEHGGSVAAVLDFGASGAWARASSGLLPSLTSDPALMAQGVSLLWRARLSGVAWYKGVTALRALGDDGIAQIDFEAGGKTVRLPCSLLAVHDGVIPNTQLTRLLGLDHIWSDAQNAFAAGCTPEGQTSAPAVWIAGDGAGIAGSEVAQLRGALSGLDVARALGALTGSAFQTRAGPLMKRIARRAAARAFVDRLYAPLPVATFTQGAAASTIVCRCEAVTLARINDAIRDGAMGPNRVKTFTRCGMGACQGRICGNPLTRIVADVTQSAPQQVGALRIRAPLKPTLISDYLEDHQPKVPVS